MQYPTHQLAHHKVAVKRINQAARLAHTVWNNKQEAQTTGIDPVLKSNNTLDYFTLKTL